jgi:hypothetical protein
MRSSANSQITDHSHAPAGPGPEIRRRHREHSSRGRPEARGQLSLIVLATAVTPSRGKAGKSVSLMSENTHSCTYSCTAVLSEDGEDSLTIQQSQHSTDQTDQRICTQTIKKENGATCT